MRYKMIRLRPTDETEHLKEKCSHAECEKQPDFVTSFWDTQKMKFVRSFACEDCFGKTDPAVFPGEVSAEVE